MTEDVEVIWVKWEWKYFCREDWTRGRVICPSGKITRSSRFNKSCGTSSDKVKSIGEGSDFYISVITEIFLDAALLFR
jgi:hypothetical protein